MATTTATVVSMTVVSLLGIRRSVRGATLCQSKVLTDDQDHHRDQRRHRDQADEVAERDDEDEQEDAGEEGRQPGAGAGTSR